WFCTPAAVADPALATVQASTADQSPHAPTSHSNQADRQHENEAVGHGSGADGGARQDAHGAASVGPIRPLAHSTAGSLTPAAGAGAGFGAGSGCGSTSTAATIKVTANEVPEGGIAIFDVSVSGGSASNYPIHVTWHIAPSDPHELPSGTVNFGQLLFGASGGTPQQVKIPLADDISYPGGDDDTQDDQTLTLTANTQGGAVDSAAANIDEEQDQQTVCICNCGCPGVMPTTASADGAPLAHTPEFMPPEHYNGGDKPHPVVSTNDVLSSTVSSATDIKVQATLMD